MLNSLRFWSFDDVVVSRLQKDVIDHYNKIDERNRIASGPPSLERLRTLDILERFLPKPPAVVLDIGGAAGVYSYPLARDGYEVHLYDLTPLHIRQAAKRAQNESRSPTIMKVGDARSIDEPNESADAVILLGPLYHLTRREDRLKALKEGHRLLREGGVLFAVGITRYASFLDGVGRGFISDPKFVKIIERDIKTGQHRNRTSNLHYFTTSFFHHPNQLKSEVESAGFSTRIMFSIDGPFPHLLTERIWGGRSERRSILWFLRTIEEDQTIIGASDHFMVIAEK